MTATQIEALSAAQGPLSAVLRADEPTTPLTTHRRTQAFSEGIRR